MEIFLEDIFKNFFLKSQYYLHWNLSKCPPRCADEHYLKMRLTWISGDLLKFINPPQISDSIAAIE